MKKLLCDHSLDVQHLVRLETLYYAGSHSFDIAGPQGAPLHHQVGERFVPILDDVEVALHRHLRHIDGVLIERKAFSIAVHIRQIPTHRASEVESWIDAILSRESSLRKRYGKKVFELQPAIDWDKGRAGQWLLRALSLEHPAVTPLYIGDDVTDEDAFLALASIDSGIGILVAASPRPTAAQFILRHPNEVQDFLQQLLWQIERD
ncbi:trehalose-phosphatase [Candidatus Entotheonella serta]|nr:trehalose-phosphatase [Candidatus Entotheonella serta]